MIRKYENHTADQPKAPWGRFTVTRHPLDNKNKATTAMASLSSPSDKPFACLNAVIHFSIIDLFFVRQITRILSFGANDVKSRMVLTNLSIKLDKCRHLKIEIKHLSIFYHQLTINDVLFLYNSSPSIDYKYHG